MYPENTVGTSWVHPGGTQSNDAQYDVHRAGCPPLRCGVKLLPFSASSLYLAGNNPRVLGPRTADATTVGPAYLLLFMGPFSTIAPRGCRGASRLSRHINRRYGSRDKMGQVQDVLVLQGLLAHN